MDAADLDLFQRSLAHVVEASSGAELDKALDEMGWTDALTVEPQVSVSLLFELLGSFGASGDALDRVLFDVLGLGGAGIQSAPVVLPAIGSWDAPAEQRDGHIRVHGLAGPAMSDAGSALVVAWRGDAHVAYPVPAEQLELRPVHGIDPWLGLVEVHADEVAVGEPLDVVPSWEAAVARAQIALSHDLIGASRKMLELAREHALERIQFGVPISSFQAVRHRLAETLVAIEMAEALVLEAWRDDRTATAAMAKAVSGRSARVAAKHCQQVLAGIGFTTEHDLHRYIRRVFVVDQLFGSSKKLTTALGNELLESRELPVPAPL